MSAINLNFEHLWHEFCEMIWLHVLESRMSNWYILIKDDIYVYAGNMFSCIIQLSLTWKNGQVVVTVFGNGRKSWICLHCICNYFLVETFFELISNQSNILDWSYSFDNNPINSTQIVWLTGICNWPNSSFDRLKIIRNQQIIGAIFERKITSPSKTYKVNAI